MTLSGGKYFTFYLLSYFMINCPFFVYSNSPPKIYPSVATLVHCTVQRFCHESGDCQVDIGHQTSDKFKQTWLSQYSVHPIQKYFQFWLLKSKVHFYRFILYVSVSSSSKNPPSHHFLFIPPCPWIFVSGTS